MVVGDLSTATDILILGAGPGGYVAAIRAAQLGRQVTLVDPGPPGGTCLHAGCIPAKALLQAAARLRGVADLEQMGISTGTPRLDYRRLQGWKQGVVDRLAGGVGKLLDAHGVVRVAGSGWFLSPTQVRVEGEHGSSRFQFDAAIIATGADPAPLADLAADGGQVLSPQQALALPELPATVAVCGEDYIAAELATLFVGLGTRVTLLLPGPGLLPDYEPAAGRAVTARLKKRGVQVHTGVRILGLAGGVLRYAGRDGETVAAAERIIISAGVRPRTAPLELAAAGLAAGPDGGLAVDPAMRTAVPHILAVGDVTGGPALATVAIAQAKVAAETAAGRAAAYQPQAVPRVVHADPEVAAVGLTAAAAAAAGYRVQTGRFPLGASGRSLTLGSAEGFALVVADADTSVLLGVTVVGPRAGDLIGEAALALEMGATLADLALTLHPHPGLSETLQESAEAALGLPVHLLKGI